MSFVTLEIIQYRHRQTAAIIQDKSSRLHTSMVTEQTYLSIIIIIYEIRHLMTQIEHKLEVSVQQSITETTQYMKMVPPLQPRHETCSISRLRSI